MRRIAFRLDPALYEALASKAASDKASHGQVVLDSVEAAHRDGVLNDLIDREANSHTGGGLFPRLATRGPAQPAVPVEIRLHARAVTILDQLVDDTGADTRTQLVVAALRRHLDPASNTHSAPGGDTPER